MSRYRVLLVLWAATIVAFAAGFLGMVGLSVAAQFMAFILAVFTVIKTDRVGELTNKLVYRGSLLVLLATTGTVLVCAGSTVAFGDSHEKPVVGLVALATTNLVAAVLAWRALTRPSPRRAAAVGLIAVIVELFALVFDVVWNLRGGTARFDPNRLAVVGMLASWAATWAGALVCMASLISFTQPSMFAVPDARVVDNE